VKRSIRELLGLALAACLAAPVGFGCSSDAEGGHDEHGGHAEAGAEEEFERGPHGGRLLEDGDFSLELTIFEDGVPPEFRAFIYQGGEPLDPAGVALEVTLARLGGRSDRIAFTQRGEYLLGDGEVAEPHSFDVEVVARASGEEHRFAYSTFENRVTLMLEQVKAAGIAVEAAEPATIRERVTLNGRIVANEDALAHVMPRFPGVVRSVHKRLGDAVAKGDLLAVIESNESLHPYELRARMAGTVLARNVAPGEFVSTDREIFSIADLSTVWADLDVYRRDFTRLKKGQRVLIDADDGSPPAEATLAYLSPVGSVNTQTLLARAVLSNADGSWRPGLFVSAQVEVGEAEAKVAVRQAALQRLRDWDVVFIADKNVFEAQPIELGRRDGERVEVVSGLAPGMPYAAAGSFVLKAEAGKSGASHDH
jgi:cobalt-zinc-cadmium efflux system membrane fusion protein